MSAAPIAQKQDYFAPSTTTKAATSPKDSSRDVTHPPIPELLDPAYLDKLLPANPSAAAPAKTEPRATQSGAEAGAAFMAALKAEGNKQYTQNSAHAFASTLNPAVDAFNGLSQATDPADFESILRKSWAQDPLLTVKIIFNLRSIHEGKSEREGFYRAWGWLYRTHPRTAIANLNALVEPLIEKKLKDKKDKEGKDSKMVDDEDAVLIDLEDEVEPRGLSHGYWKDLLNLLTLATEGQLDVGASQFTALHSDRQSRGDARLAKGRRVAAAKVKKVNRPRGHVRHAKGWKDPQTQDTRIAASLQRDTEASNRAKAARASKEVQWRERVQKLITESKPYKALYITVTQLFARGLEADIDILQRISDPATDDKQRIKLSFDISLCAKYAPSINGSHDRMTNIASAIAELLWNKGKLRIPYDQTAGTSPSNDTVHNLRSSYTRWILSPLRRFIQIPELYMSSNRWNELPYKRVASTCMQKHKSHFFQHDESRFSNYLKDVAAGKRTISGATLLPHSLLGEALKVDSNGYDGDPATKAEVQVIEAQWKTLVDNLKKSGTLDNSMAVCDVSGSMGHILDSNMSGNYDHVSPILPAVALSLVLSQVSAEPWANSFITFSERPEIVKIDRTAGLVETAKSMVTAAWDMNTDFNAVFTKLILPMAKEHKLPKEAMIKRLFVFSDMEFDESGGNVTNSGGTVGWTTEHEKIVKEFEAAGYDCPDIVYWNLQGARGAKPVQADWEGVAVMSGFSSNMLKTFMDKGGLEEEGEEEIEIIEQIEGDEVVIKKKEKKKMTPEDIMKKALNKPSYATLVVVD